MLALLLETTTLDRWKISKPTRGPLPPSSSKLILEEAMLLTNLVL